ncbi:50S ribosomal protein L17 [Desulfocurvus sp. DL9XJH121]
MRHKKAGKKLNMDSSQRKAMFRNMARSMVVHESIRTTETRAKELRKVVERLVTYALKNTVASRREAYKVLGNHALVQRLFDEIGPRYAAGGGGYTRVIKLGMPRVGDCAPLAVIEFTKKAGEKAEEAKPAKKAAPKKAAASKAAAEEPKAEAPEVEEAPEAPEAEDAAEAPEAEEAEEEAEPKEGKAD